MTPLARLDTLTLAVELTLLVTIGLLGAHAVDTWAADRERQAQEAELIEQLADRNEALDFAERFMVHCLSGRIMVVGRVAGVRCYAL